MKYRIKMLPEYIERDKDVILQEIQLQTGVTRLFTVLTDCKNTAN